MTITTPEQNRSHLFTVRVWQEDLDDGRTEWRGQIKHILTGETRYFRHWSQLQSIIQDCLPDWDLQSGGVEDGR